MTTEYELGCVQCGEPLTRREVAAESLGVEDGGAVAVAECPACGSRYFPEETLRQLSG